MKKTILFIIIYVVSLSLALFVFVIGLAGGHRLYFSSAGGTIALIVSTLTLIPLLHFFIIRKKVQKSTRIIIGFLSFSLFMGSYMLIYVGVPTMTKQFIEDTCKCNLINVENNNEIDLTIELAPEMFDRVGVHTIISKVENIKISNIELEITDNNSKLLLPVFKPTAWDSLQYDTKKMDSFFELNDFTKLNKFSISAQYPIEHLDSLKLNVGYTYLKNDEMFKYENNYSIEISDILIFEKLINYK